MKPNPDVKQTTIFGLHRGEDGRYNDDELSKVLLDAIEAPAHHFGARSVPEAMRIVEILSMEQARSWGCCSVRWLFLLAGGDVG